MTTELVIELAKLFGPMGFIMWLMFYITRHTIPNLVKSFDDSTNRQREEFREMSLRQREDFRDMLSKEQQTHEKQTNRMIDAIQKISPWRRFIG